VHAFVKFTAEEPASELIELGEIEYEGNWIKIFPAKMPKHQD
jgi:hypothetical protein